MQQQQAQRTSANQPSRIGSINNPTIMQMNNNQNIPQQVDQQPELTVQQQIGYIMGLLPTLATKVDYKALEMRYFMLSEEYIGVAEQLIRVETRYEDLNGKYSKLLEKYHKLRDLKGIWSSRQRDYQERFNELESALRDYNKILSSNRTVTFNTKKIVLDIEKRLSSLKECSCTQIGQKIAEGTSIKNLNIPMVESGDIDMPNFNNQMKPNPEDTEGRLQQTNPIDEFIESFIFVILANKHTDEKRLQEDQTIGDAHNDSLKDNNDNIGDKKDDEISKNL